MRLARSAADVDRDVDSDFDPEGHNFSLAAKQSF
jgi:hypothetical protein